MWARFDDKYYGNPKVLNAGHEGRDLHMASVIWVAGYAPTTGLIPKLMLPPIAYLAGVKMSRQKRVATLLVNLNLWEEFNAANWLLHDFRVYLPKDETNAARQARFRNGKVTARNDQPSNSNSNATRPDPENERTITKSNSYYSLDFVRGGNHAN